MAATMTQNQLGWKQFASTLIQRERGVDVETEKWDHKVDRNDDEHHDDDDDNSDTSSSTNTRASRAIKQKHSNPAGKSKTVKWSKTKIIFATNEQQPTEEPAAFDEPKKARTRAQRRAVEEIPEPAAPIQKNRREQRTDYWVMHDDKRRSRARAMKAMMSVE